MAIPFGNEYKTISKVVISTVFDQDGAGIYPYTLWSEYRELQHLAKKLGITIFSKSSMRYSEIGNFQKWNPLTWKYIQKIHNNGMLNACGPTNRGVEENSKRIVISCRNGFKVIPSYYLQFKKGFPQAIHELGESVAIYQKYMGNYFWAIELNASCLNLKGEIISENMDNVVTCIAMLKEVYPWLVVIVKTNIVHPYSFYKKLENVGTDVIHAINSIPYDIVFPDDISPLYEVGGGAVSGGPASDLAYEYNKKLRDVTSLPIIMACGVTDIFSKARLLKIGANSIGICTIVSYSPSKASSIITS